MATAQAAVSDATATSDSIAAAQDRNFDVRQKVLNQRTAENNYRYGVAQYNCYSKFFVNNCLTKARDTMREERSSIKQQQLALNDEQRAVRAKRRDEELALKAAQGAASDAARAVAYANKQRENELKRAQRDAEASPRAVSQ
ncbi:MAG: hypothetical protein E5299_01326 [Burkholderia gladioli]|nr:MAG: hypothetical protein E5299_01326 [Burkholderia gladioli]